VLCHSRYLIENGMVVEKWWLEGSGRRVSPHQAAWLLERMVPNGDGLFGDSQTWRVDNG
jgi:hypothetical protein